MENVCVYNIILIRWLYTISFGHIIIGWYYCHAEDVSPHFDGMWFLVADVNNHQGWCICLFPMLVIGWCYCQVTVADVIATYNTAADVIAFCFNFVDWCYCQVLCGRYYFTSAKYNIFSYHNMWSKIFHIKLDSNISQQKLKQKAITSASVLYVAITSATVTWQ